MKNHYIDLENTRHPSYTVHFRCIFYVLKCIPCNDDDDDDDDGVVGKLFYIVVKLSKIESVSILHSRFIGLYIFKVSRTKRAWQPKTFPTVRPFGYYSTVLQQSDSSLDPPLYKNEV